MATDYLTLMEQNKNAVPNIGATTVATKPTAPLVTKANVVPKPSTGATITGANTKNTTPITVVQPQPAVGNAILQSDIISKGQADTARAIADEAKVAQAQGQTSVANTLANYVKDNSKTQTTTTPAPTGATPTDTTTTPINVNGITADTVAQQKEQVASAIANQTGETALTSQAYANTVDPAQKELSDINQQMNEEALAGRRRKEAVLLLPGITKSQAQDKINEIDRNNTSRLADLAIIQMAKQGQYDSAKTIADRLVQAKLEDQKNKNNALLFTYQENKDLFNKAEQRQFEQAHADRERKLNAEEKQLTRISDLSLNALQNGAPASVATKMRGAKTEAEAMAIGGQYVDKLDRTLKNAQISKIYSDIANEKLKREAETGGVKNIATLQAYANEFAQGNKIPSPNDLKGTGLTVADITTYAKQLPRTAGSIVDKNTGVKPLGLTDSKQGAISALYDITKKVDRLKQLDSLRAKGLSGGLVSGILGGKYEDEYAQLRSDVTDLLSKARSGAATGVLEQKVYDSMLPGRFANTFGLGKNTQQQLEVFNKSINDTLKTNLGTGNLVIEGYSTVVIPELQSISNPTSQFRVGDILDYAGTKYRVLSDGTLTDVI